MNGPADTGRAGDGHAHEWHFLMGQVIRHASHGAVPRPYHGPVSPQSANTGTEQ
ncbi:MAG: hypothetical protein O2967_22335 [Proteobacteria bacterium]|nr:hypothetical protein [Pseudomonadota bacterium]